MMIPAIFCLFFTFFYPVCQCELVIDDFTTSSNITLWQEYSDTVMPGGKSLAKLVHHRTSASSKAVLFTLLDPQACGAAIAGAKRSVDLDLSPYEEVSLKVRGRGQYYGYEFVLRNREDEAYRSPSYVQFFEAKPSFETVTLPLADFKPYLKGVPLDKSEPLDLKHITSVGILGYGGAHLAKKQFGVAALEIEWIRVQ